MRDRNLKSPLAALFFHLMACSNALAQQPAETVLVEGEAAQTVMRWEDYTQTAIDPSDDCTVWYVGDYIKQGETSYSSRIGAFRMPGCKGKR